MFVQRFETRGRRFKICITIIITNNNSNNITVLSRCVGVSCGVYNIQALALTKPSDPSLSDRCIMHRESVIGSVIIIMIMAVVSIAPYLTDKGEHTAVYKINNNVYFKT